jgi:glycine hydroxymethyltransferase
MAEGDMKEIASLIGRAVRADGPTGERVLTEIAAAVGALVARHPAYPR